jgi:hypothetical protein
LVFILPALFAFRTLPESLDLTVAWTITLAGMVGAAATSATIVIAMFATLQNNVASTEGFSIKVDPVDWTPWFGNAHHSDHVLRS